MKNGGATITVLRSADTGLAAKMRAKCEEMIGAQKKIVGFAIVAWGPDGGSCSSTEISDGSMIPSIMVPDFVRNRLLAERVIAWTMEEVEKS